jgi:tRNA pseudouridine55 synthase
MSTPCAPRADLSGILVVDKPTEMSSHDVVQRVRRLLGVRRVGHAGTLDPLASGVLVVMVGEATKLAPFLTAEDKTYEALVRLGTATNTLDAEGEITHQMDVPEWFDDPKARTARIDAALELERARTEQHPPRFSAIKVGGKTGYARARAGEQFDLEPRAVRVHDLELKAVSLTRSSSTGAASGRAADLGLLLRVSKGYYVRSLARDLGAHLGIPAHLRALRRVRSGAFSLEQAVALTGSPAELSALLMPLEQAARAALPCGVLSPEGVELARCGKLVPEGSFELVPPPGVVSAWLTGEGRLVAIGELPTQGPGRVVRGFTDRSP